MNLYFVRHGEAASSWDKASDPGLSELGHQQARNVSTRIQKMTECISVCTSPLLRAQETSAPLAETWGQTPRVISNIAEIPSDHIPFEERRRWLQTMMNGSWSEQPNSLKEWRENILQVIQSQTEDAVFFTHFMVINTIVSAIEKTDKVVSFRPDNCSITHISVKNGQIKLIERGGEAITVVQ